MIKKMTFLASAALLAILPSWGQKQPVDYVNPFVGTTNYGTTNP